MSVMSAMSSSSPSRSTTRTRTTQAVLAGLLLIGVCVAAEAGPHFVETSRVSTLTSAPSMGLHLPETAGREARSVRSRCARRAAAFYRVDPNIVRAIMKVEGGTAGRKSANTNGTHDYGVMQVNTLWLSQQGLDGITPAELKNKACLNIWVGTWILAKQIIGANGDTWRGIGNYHSRTPKYHNRYREKVRRVYQHMVREQSRS